jgi:hypothetical protein
MRLTCLPRGVSEGLRVLRPWVRHRQHRVFSGPLVWPPPAGNAPPAKPRPRMALDTWRITAADACYARPPGA